MNALAGSPPMANICGNGPVLRPPRASVTPASLGAAVDSHPRRRYMPDSRPRSISSGSMQFGVMRYGKGAFETQPRGHGRASGRDGISDGGAGIGARNPCRIVAHVGGSVAGPSVAFSLRYNSRIDKGRSKLTLTAPDKTQTTLPIVQDGPEDILATRPNCRPAPIRCAAGARDRRAYHAGRRAVHRHGIGTLRNRLRDEPSDRPVRLHVRHPARTSPSSPSRWRWRRSCS